MVVIQFVFVLTVTVISLTIFHSLIFVRHIIMIHDYRANAIDFLSLWMTYFVVFIWVFRKKIVEIVIAQRTAMAVKKLYHAFFHI